MLGCLPFIKPTSPSPKVLWCCNDSGRPNVPPVCRSVVLNEVFQQPNKKPVMKKYLFNPLTSFLIATVVLAAETAGAGTTTWSGGGAANQNWSASANWTTVGGGTPPVAGDGVIFRNAGVAAAAGTVNSIVDSSFNAAIGGLVISNETTTAFHTIQIPSGNTLAVSGPIMVGGTNNSIVQTITGGGTLAGGTGTSTFVVSTINNTAAVTLDMSGLTNFIFNSGGAGAAFTVGLDPGFNCGAVLKLAAISNNITATTLTVANNNNGGSATLNLGAGTNIINANTIEMGDAKASGTMNFGSATGGLRLRNAAGTGRTTVDMAGTPSHSGSASTPAVANLQLNGHYVDMMIGTLTLGNRNGRGSSGGNGALTAANFSFNSGVVDVTTLNMSVNASGGTNVTATMSVGGGVLKVANNISLVNDLGNAVNTGTLIVTNGGLVSCGGIIKSTTAGTGIISVTNATVTVNAVGGTIGVPGTPVDTINLNGATVHLALDANNPGSPTINAGAINASGVNTIAIDSLANAFNPVTLQLISYSGTDPYANLHLSLPFGYTGNLIDGAGLIQVTITPPTIVSLTWTGATNSVLTSSWDTNKTMNWIDGGSTPQAYANPDPVTFDDSAVNSLVTVITTNTPNSITINNSSLNYVFNGPGKISGSIGINKQGNAALTLADNGDDFSGGIIVSGGTLILDNTNGAISGGLTIYGGTVAQIGNNDTHGALPAGTLDVEGTLVYQRSDNISLGFSIPGYGGLTQNGNGTLTLAVTNDYFGPTVASKGTLAFAIGNAITFSSGLLVSNATFDVSALGTSPAMMMDLSLTNAVINLAAQPNLQPAIYVNTLESVGTTAKSNIINVASLPGVAMYPATIPLIQSTNAMTLAGGQFNFALGSLPAASPSFVGQLSPSADGTTILLTLTAGPVGTRSIVIWNGTNGVSASTNWSDALNWQFPGAPGAADNVVFAGNGVETNDASTVNNVVDTSLSVASLTYNQNGAGVYHITEIPAGVTLNVSGNVTVGNQTGDSATNSTYLTGGGAFVAGGSVFSVNNFSAGSANTALALLDLSGLSDFVYNNAAGTMNIANATSGNRFGGMLVMAGVSNNVTAGTINFMENNASNGGNTDGSGIEFGAGTNVVNVGTFNIVGGKNTGTVKFNPAAPATAGLRIRGANGNSDDTSRAIMTIGVRNSTGTGTTSGTLALNGNPVDIKVGSLTMGEDTQSGGNGANGTLSFDTGLLDVTSIVMGHTGNSAVSSGVGTINVGAGAKLIIGSGGLSMVNQSSGGGAAGNLNISGGTVIASNNITKATTGGTATIALTDGTLNMVSGAIGSLGLPIDALNLSDNGSHDTSIRLNVVVGITNICATAVNIFSGVTTINVGSIAGLTGTQQIPLISYANGGDPISGLVLGSTPAGYVIGNGGALVDNQGNQTVDIIVTPPAPVVWKGSVSGNWDSSTLNWLNGASSVAYADGKYVQFDDTASTFNVNLTTALAPGGSTINNSSHNYTFSGSGRLTGFGGLAKNGSATLTLDNSGTNDFIGQINIAAGTLQLGNNDSNGNLPGSVSVIDNGNLAFDRVDASTVANVISGAGNVLQLGTGTNRLTGPNTYTGNTVISAGMITVSTAAAGNTAVGPTTGAGSIYITNGGTFDIENGTANTMSFTNTMDTAGKQFFIAGAGVGGNGAIVNNGATQQQEAFQNITLTGNATVGGPTRWDMRVPDGKFQPILDLGGYTLTKTGSNQMSMVALIVTNGGNIIINNGTLSFETISSNSTTPITVNAGGVLGHYRENATLFTAPITLNGGMIRDLNGAPGSTNDSPITLTANSFLDLNVGSTDQLRLNGNITESSGSFGLTKTNGGSYSLAGVNTYSGNTVIVGGALILANNGSIANSKLISVGTGTTFDASQRTDQTLTLNAGQTLGGFGTVTGLVTTASGSTVAPGSGSAVGMLTFDNNVTVSGTNTMKVTHATSATNDVLNVVNSSLSVGGTLNVTLLGSSFAAGDSFKLYNSPGGLSVTLTATNLPALPGGLGWDTTNLVNGVLRIIAAVNPNPTSITATVSGNTLNLSWPADHTGWTLQAQTNAIGAGLNPNPASWVNVPGSASVNSEAIPVDPTKGTVFYRLVLP